MTKIDQPIPEGRHSWLVCSACGWAGTSLEAFVQHIETARANEAAIQKAFQQATGGLYEAS